eukprot:6201556-Pleurochrysis_carterae.AAC.1
MLHGGPRARLVAKSDLRVRVLFHACGGGAGSELARAGDLSQIRRSVRPDTPLYGEGPTVYVYTIYWTGPEP